MVHLARVIVSNCSLDLVASFTCDLTTHAPLFVLNRTFRVPVCLSHPHAVNRPPCCTQGRVGLLHACPDQPSPHLLGTPCMEDARHACAFHQLHSCCPPPPFSTKVVCCLVQLMTPRAWSVEGALLAKGPDSSFGEVYRGSCSGNIHIEEEVKDQEDEVEGGRDK